MKADREMAFFLKNMASRQILTFGVFILMVDLFSAKLEAKDESLPLIEINQSELEQARRLDEPWAFVWQKLISPEQSMPRQETRRIGEIWPDKGYASYRVQISIPDGIDQVRLLFPRIQGGIRVWVNNELVAKRGEVSLIPEQNIAKAGTLLVHFKAPAPIFTLTLQLSSFDHRTPGSFHPPWIGSAQGIELIHERSLISDSWMIGVLMTMGLWNFIIFSINRYKSYGALPFALTCFFIAARLLFAGDAALVYSIHDISFVWHYRLEYIFFYMAFLCLVLFIRRLFPYALPRAVLFLVAAVTGVKSVMTALTEVGFFSEFLFVTQYLAIMTAIVVIIGGLISFKRKVYDSGFFVLSLLMFSVASINDILFYQKLIDTVLITHYGFAGFLFFQSILISKRFARAEKFDQEQKMTTDTIRKSQQVYESYIDSLDKVAGVESRFYYHSAEKTGGDWLVVHHEPEQKLIYLALGDVSGHGINSALFTLSMTSAVKQAFVGLASVPFHPDRMRQAISDVNETVFQAAEVLQKHITVVFLAIDLMAGHCHYFNAGHCSIILSDQEKTRCILKPGSPIGMFAKTMVGYDTFQLKGATSLLLYTDGLLENGESRGQRIRLRELMTVMKFGKSIDEYQQGIQDLIAKKWDDKVQLDDDTTSLLLQFHLTETSAERQLA